MRSALEPHTTWRLSALPQRHTTPHISTYNFNSGLTDKAHSPIMQHVRQPYTRAHTLFLALTMTGCLQMGSEQPSERSLEVASARLHTSSNLLSTSTPTVCFVKGADPTNFNAWASAMQAAMAQWEDASGLRFAFQGECGAPVNGVYPGDIRILVNEPCLLEGGAIPGCNQTLESASSAAFPGTIPATCKFNASLCGPAVNYVLHESGHAIGFLHEHQRSDTPVGCHSDPNNGDGLLLTPHDVESVMNYGPQGGSCGENGNLGSKGLSAWDRLGAEISYPKNPNIPIAAAGGMAYSGGVAFRNSGGSLAPEWYARGALASVFSSFDWTIGSSQTTGLSRTTSIGLGSPVTATMHFTDPWGRSRSGSKIIWHDNAKHAAVVVATM